MLRWSRYNTKYRNMFSKYQSVVDMTIAFTLSENVFTAVIMSITRKCYPFANDSDKNAEKRKVFTTVSSITRGFTNMCNFHSLPNVVLVVISINNQKKYSVYYSNNLVT